MKTGQDTITLCSGCSKRVPIGELRYHWKTGDFVCLGCFSNANLEKERKEVNLPNQEKRIEYRCRECGHLFSRNENFVVTELCFFCGKEGVVRADKKEHKIITELEDGILKNSKEL